MPISFLEQQQLPAKLKARQLVREFASHRYGIFKESGFRYDPIYPPFSSLPGLPVNLNASRKAFKENAARVAFMDIVEQQSNSTESFLHIRGFDENWNECSFETNPTNGLPVSNSMNCLPYLTRATDNSQVGSTTTTPTNHLLPSSLNLMSSDPFSYASLGGEISNGKTMPGFRQLQSGSQTIEWRELSDSTSWHFCGDNFQSSTQMISAPGNGIGAGGGGVGASSRQTENQQQQRLTPTKSPANFAHNQLTTNKQNIMCQERSGMEVIKSSDDFRHNPFSLLSVGLDISKSLIEQLTRTTN